MTVTTTVMQEIAQYRAEQQELDAWLDKNWNLHRACGSEHSPGARPGSCARCVTHQRLDQLDRVIVRLLRYGAK